MKNSEGNRRVEVRRSTSLVAMQITNSLLFFTLVFGVATLLRAQNDNSRAGTKTYFLYPAPPEGFNAVTASDEELEEYGFPPRPYQGELALYKRWQKIVTASTTRLTNVEIRPNSKVGHGVVRNRQDQGTTANANTSAGAANATTPNWSGYVISAPTGTFNMNNTSIQADWIVPGVSAPYGIENCAYGPYETAIWVGLDGYNNNDVLQAGTVSSACPNSSPVAWFEWYTADCAQNSYTTPCDQMDVPGLSINTGDDVDVIVWYTTSAPQGHALITDFTSGQGVSVGFSQPEVIGAVPTRCSDPFESGCTTGGEKPAPGLQGISAEWIVERPSVGGAYANLANFGTVAMNFPWLTYNGSTFYPSSSPVGTPINLAMSCLSASGADWNPSSACSSSNQDLSIVQLGQLDATSLDGNSYSGGYSSSQAQILWFSAVGPTQ